MSNSKQSLKSIKRTATRIIKMTGADPQLATTIEHMIFSVVANRDRVIEYQSRKLKDRKVVVDITRITGALRNTITAHGPITPQVIGSAAKRICGQIQDLADPAETCK